MGSRMRPERTQAVLRRAGRGHMSEGSSADDQASPHAKSLAVETPATGWVELTAPSREEYLDRIASFLDTLAGAILDEDAREEVKFAVAEIASNAMEWGNCGDERRRVHVSYGLFPAELVLKIEDEGEGFDPESVPDPTVSPGWPPGNASAASVSTWPRSSWTRYSIASAGTACC